MTGRVRVAERVMARVVGRIRRRESFRALARPDGRAASRGLSVAYCAANAEAEALHVPVVAYAVGRAHGGAVERNRVRRRLRAAVREVAPSLPQGAYLVRADPSVGSLLPAELGRAVREAVLGAAGRARGARPAAPGGAP